MKQKYRNLFLIFGIVVLGIMVAQLPFKQVWEGVQHAGYWFVAVVFLWLFLYLFNTAAWWLIIRSQEGEWPIRKLTFAHLYRLTVSGFALNYATPGGLMGGEPYRIMALSPILGTKRATASVVLYSMTHIFSHFWFWLLSVFLYVATRPVDLPMGILLLGIMAFCLLGLWFFMHGYKRGLAVSTMTLLRHVPLLGSKISRFLENHRKQLDDIDRQIAALHRQQRRTFWEAVGLELLCRVASALEIYFILLVLLPSVNYLDCIMVLAFTSWLANLLFFMPLQLGGREGGFMLSVTELSMSAGAAALVALLVRLRELIWVAIGLLLIKIDK